ncbi:MAG: Dam family site-specific DNA-(adenine-N6)-methyltransferase [Methylomonas sp.]|jgi:DNA adenine methylase|uniref:DNA adenine methylase n=1 Tax=Methylomonas sp. TaxID=418 RepID=UPI0025DAA4A9|nr:Dam family site-specific DNA-(adenine-N6)-methyltransferase [Methylomonas sp.]MCK9608183.1 Dam family site-specific DNA-(adenine-N6)-methyltransferase [Methylomonas sp.]
MADSVAQSTTCALCGKIFKYRSHLQKHNQRKTPCAIRAPISQDRNLAQSAESGLEEKLSRLSLASREDIHPPLKWLGGKSQILEEIIGAFPENFISTFLANHFAYREPFLGGGSVLIGFLQRIRSNGIIADYQNRANGRIFASDINPHLINFYKCIQVGLPAFVDALRQIANEFSDCPDIAEAQMVNAKAAAAKQSKDEYYYAIRDRFNENAEGSTPPGERIGDGANHAAQFYFLNHIGFRGVYRENSSGKFNVPYGHYKNAILISGEIEENFRRLSELFQPVIFSVRQFDAAIQDATAGDFIYLDPPYVQENATSFTSYSAAGFNDTTHQRLFDMIHVCSDKKIRVLLSNSATKKVCDAFVNDARFRIREIICRRAINSQNPAATARELLISN